jgi:phage tail-like protein
MAQPNDNSLAPLPVFRFQVDFFESTARASDPGTQTSLAICSGAFSECSGLEATMEPFVIRPGGLNYGAVQRVGKVSFATVILRRGATTTRHLWQWFALVNGAQRPAYAYRLDAKVTVFDHAGEPRLRWKLARALPVKFKAAELNALSINIGVEELQLTHEGLTLEPV